MGCWSESCALSGLEIQMGEENVYVALLAKSKYGEAMYDIVVPPVKGTYDDYGGIDLEEDCFLLGLKKGDNWRPMEDDEDGNAPKGEPVYISGAVFDFLPNLLREFYYHGATLEEAYEYHLSEVREKIEESRKTFEMLADASENEDSRNQFRSIQVSMAFGLSNSVLPSASKLYQDLNGGDDSEFFKFYKRAFMLQCAQMELRKLVVPGVRGPQHCGEVALNQFYGLVGPIVKARVDEAEAQRIQDEKDFG